MTGNVISIKKKNSHAQVSRISGVTISGHSRRNYTLYPGVDDKQRCITVNGASYHDVPVSYSVVGLENYELPVIGEFFCDIFAMEESVRPAQVRASHSCKFALYLKQYLKA